MQRPSTQHIAAMWQAIDELDFERIKAKLLHRDHGEARIEAVRRAEIGYRQFLKLAAKYPDVPVVPSEAVDEFWHMHILDTQRYGSDCEAIFGHMLHHDPYLGIGGEEHETERLQVTAASEALMRREFGQANEGLGATAVYCVKALEEMSATAYCVRPLADESCAAYCVRAMAQASDAAYCVRPMAEGTSAAYCVRAMAGGASAAYCVRPMAEGASAAYCVRPMAEGASAAYCVRPMAKGASAAYCVRPMAQSSDAGYCVRAVAGQTSAAYCVRPMSLRADEAYCVRPVAQAHGTHSLS